MPKLTIDGIEVEVEAGTSIIQACEQIGIEIPRFCYHEKLSVPANCRMCLVELEKSPKPVPSCAMPCADGMVVKTNSPQAQKARKGVMEFLLINHPLDCPICDQGGECDLQDQAVAYGFDRGRYGENKRAVQEKYLGPLIKTYMTRCIQCTRCVRFSDEIAGVTELGFFGRSEHAEIGTYIRNAIGSELSGNLVDVCPVGALVSKPYRFTARPWELKKTLSIDVHDAVGSNIRIDSRGSEVMRVLPRINDEINEDWLGDKSRYSYDGLQRQRLDRPYIRVDGKLRPASWNEAFAVIGTRLSGLAGDRIAAIAGDLCDAESMLALKDLMTVLGSSNLECRQDGARFEVSERAGYLFNTTIAGIERADAVLLIGANPRWEAPLVNARIRKRWLAGGLRVGAIGPQLKPTYPLTQLGAGTQTVQELIDGRHAFREALDQAERPMLILGMGALRREDGETVHAAARALAQATGMIKPDWNGFNILHTAAARVGALSLGFVPGANGRDMNGILAGAERGEIDAVYLLGADEFDTGRLGNAFVIYQGHHGDRGAHRADVILPGAAYTEKNGTYVNLEGRAQTARMAHFPPGEAREDWKILRALSDVLGRRLAYDSLAQVRERLAGVNPAFGSTDRVAPAEWKEPGQAESRSSRPMAGAPFAYAVENYYMTDAISRASVTMAQCTDEFVNPAQGATGTHG